ncbi:hypothetical protein B0T17DRAFT_119462 [Bombardia bombarda]|uniref:Uncharacterized protein n=1 Tax=Bombardia bombarda TaxID=252184 RepID=A0AA39W440_9PEZI|nr:hypothetical protein B0T17DRAFT_119462 [Bombardia bombarda]
MVAIAQALDTMKDELEALGVQLRTGMESSSGAVSDIFVAIDAFTDSATCLKHLDGRLPPNSYSSSAMKASAMAEATNLVFAKSHELRGISGIYSVLFLQWIPSHRDEIPREIMHEMSHDLANEARRGHESFRIDGSGVMSRKSPARSSLCVFNALQFNFNMCFLEKRIDALRSSTADAQKANDEAARANEEASKANARRDRHWDDLVVHMQDMTLERENSPATQDMMSIFTTAVLRIPTSRGSREPSSNQYSRDSGSSRDAPIGSVSDSVASTSSIPVAASGAGPGLFGSRPNPFAAPIASSGTGPGLFGSHPNPLPAPIDSVSRHNPFSAPIVSADAMPGLFRPRANPFSAPIVSTRINAPASIDSTATTGPPTQTDIMVQAGVSIQTKIVSQNDASVQTEAEATGLHNGGRRDLIPNGLFAWTELFIRIFRGVDM